MGSMNLFIIYKDDRPFELPPEGPETVNRLTDQDDEVETTFALASTNVADVRAMLKILPDLLDLDGDDPIQLGFHIVKVELM
jgi:hypothetical protein